MLCQRSKFPMLRAYWQFDKVTGLSRVEPDRGVYVGWNLFFHEKLCIMLEQMDLSKKKVFLDNSQDILCM